MNKAQIEEAADLLYDIDNITQRVQKMGLSLEYQTLSHDTTFLHVRIATDELMKIINRSLKEKKARLKDLGVEGF